MAEYKDDDRVMVYNRNTGITQPVRWKAVKNANTRRTQGLEIVGQPQPKSTDVDREKVEKLKAEFANEKPKKAKVEPEPENDLPENEVFDEPNINEMPLKALKELATERGIDFVKNARKDKMIELLSK
jgi:transcriptional regulator of met regulon